MRLAYYIPINRLSRKYNFIVTFSRQPFFTSNENRMIQRKHFIILVVCLFFTFTSLNIISADTICKSHVVSIVHDMKSPIIYTPEPGEYITSVIGTGNFTFASGSQPMQSCSSTKPVARPGFNAGCNGPLTLGLSDDGKSYNCGFDTFYEDNGGSCNISFEISCIIGKDKNQGPPCESKQCCQ